MEGQRQTCADGCPSTAPGPKPPKMLDEWTSFPRAGQASHHPAAGLLLSTFHLALLGRNAGSMPGSPLLHTDSSQPSVPRRALLPVLAQPGREVHDQVSVGITVTITNDVPWLTGHLSVCKCLLARTSPRSCRAECHPGRAAELDWALEPEYWDQSLTGHFQACYSE